MSNKKLDRSKRNKAKKAEKAAHQKAKEQMQIEQEKIVHAERRAKKVQP